MEQRERSNQQFSLEKLEHLFKVCGLDFNKSKSHELGIILGEINQFVREIQKIKPLMRWKVLTALLETRSRYEPVNRFLSKEERGPFKEDLQLQMMSASYFDALIGLEKIKDPIFCLALDGLEKITAGIESSLQLVVTPKNQPMIYTFITFLINDFRLPAKTR